LTKQRISIPEAPEYDPVYAQAIRAGNTVYLGGTMGVDVATGQFVGPTIKEQTRQALRNCQTLLRAAGADLSDVVMIHVLLKNSEDGRGLSEVFLEFFPDAEPPRCMSRIGIDRPELLVSLQMTAVID
jgi:2-iminobutanoate/2-iminopropanoate deaminase